MKILKYEGMVKLKIFWRFRKLETGLSGFKLKRVQYGKFGLQIFITHPYFIQPNTPLALFPSLCFKNPTHPPFSSPFRLLLPYTHTHTNFLHPISSILPSKVTKSSGLLIFGYARRSASLQPLFPPLSSRFPAAWAMDDGGRRQGKVGWVVFVVFFRSTLLPYFISHFFFTSPWM